MADVLREAEQGYVLANRNMSRYCETDGDRTHHPRRSCLGSLLVSLPIPQCAIRDLPLSNLSLSLRTSPSVTSLRLRVQDLLQSAVCVNILRLLFKSSPNTLRLY